MKRIVCVVEGHGETEAAPVLCARILHELLGVNDWYVDESPIRLPRGLMVDPSRPSPNRLPNTARLNDAAALALGRNALAMLVLCDADDDCPASWGPAVPQQVSRAGRTVTVRAVMACREYESWLLWSFEAEQRNSVRAANPEVSPRDAKRALASLVNGYSPSVDQLPQTRALNLREVWARSDSFDKLVRSLAALVEVTAPSRPS